MVDEAAHFHYHHQLDLYIVVVLMIWMVRFQIIRKKQSILRPLSLCSTATSDPSALVYLRIVQVSSELLNAFRSSKIRNFQKQNFKMKFEQTSLYQCIKPPL